MIRQEGSGKSGENRPRVFYAPEAASLSMEPGGLGNAEVLLDLSPEESRHALRVLRVKVGDSILLFDGKGFFYDARVAGASRRVLSARLASRIESRSDPRTRLVLLVALLKGRKSDYLVQKSVELGVGEIIFFPSERSVAKAPAVFKDRVGALDRWEKIIVSACKQCRRATLMGVRLARSLEEALDAAPEKSARFVFWENAGEDGVVGETGGKSEIDPDSGKDSGAGSKCSFPHGVCATIGPEGGFARGEIEEIRAAGFRPLSLGSRILRAETAAVAAATILLFLAGDLGDSSAWFAGERPIA